ncbi:hypothetical protein [Nocardia stercoris]|nr:hypothetical protein [Nocardia stercoris]
MARILADYTAASRGVLEHLTEIDAKTTRAGGSVFDRPHTEPELDRPETPPERAAREARAERDRQARTATHPRRYPAHGREEVVYPSDWTDVDRARDEDDGPPPSWVS